MNDYMRWCDEEKPDNIFADAAYAAWCARRNSEEDAAWAALPETEKAAILAEKAKRREEEEEARLERIREIPRTTCDLCGDDLVDGECPSCGG